LASNKAALTHLRIFYFSNSSSVWTYLMYFRMGTTQGPFQPSLVHIGQVVSDEKIKCKNVMTRQWLPKKCLILIT